MTTTITLPARPFATGWLNAALFASTDKASDHYRTIRLAAAYNLDHPTGASHDTAIVELTANSNYTAMRSHIDESTIDEGSVTCVGDEGCWPITDADHRGHSLAAYILAATRGLDPEVDSMPDVTVTIRPAAGSQPAFDGLARLEASIDFDGCERVTLPVSSVPVEHWDMPGKMKVGDSTGVVTVNPAYLALLGKLRGIDPSTLYLTSYERVIRWEARSTAGTSEVAGMIATIRHPNTDTATVDVEPTAADLEAERSANLDATVAELDRKEIHVEATGPGDVAAVISEIQARQKLTVV